MPTSKDAMAEAAAIKAQAPRSLLLLLLRPVHSHNHRMVALIGLQRDLRQGWGDRGEAQGASMAIERSQQRLQHRSKSRWRDDEPVRVMEDGSCAAALGCAP
jgi:hypothetical protein